MSGIPRCNSARWLTWLLVGAAPAVPGAPAAGQDEARQRRRTPVVIAVERVHDAVVNISSTQTIQVRRSPFGFDSIFDDIFDLPPRSVEATSVGSGFIIHPDGYIVTNAHVVNQSVSNKAVFDDGRSFPADLVAVDEEHDLAVLKIAPDRPLHAIPLGRADDLMIGETVIAVGNPLGYQHTVTTGVISAVQRDLEFRRGGREVVYRNLIQTDASINPGNSGGPLLNINGELIGVNTAIRGDAQNIGFAIPVDQLRRLLPDMLDVERLKKVQLGMKVGGTGEAVVTEVAEGGPADKAGLRPGDRLVSINRTKIDRDVDFFIEMISHQPGDQVTLELKRNGKLIQARVDLEEAPKPDGVRLARRLFGMELALMSDEAARRMRIPSGSGLLVTAVDRGSPADQGGIEPGDVVIQIGRFPVNDVDLPGRLLGEVRTGDRVFFSTLHLERDGLYRYDYRLTAE